MGDIASKPFDQKTTTYGENEKFVFASSELQGWRLRMDDVNFHVLDLVQDVSVFGIFDGYCGIEIAQFAKKHFIEELMQNQKFKEQNIEEALRETFLKIDELLLTKEGQKELQQIKGEGQLCPMTGCTAHIALFHKNNIYIANAGDSRSVLCRNLTNYDLNLIHEPDNLEEKQRIENAGGYISDGRINGNLNISRSLGNFDYKQDVKLKRNEQLLIADPDITKVEIGPYDKFLLMGSQGIFDSLEHEQLIELINQKTYNKVITQQMLAKVAEELLDQLLAPDTTVGTGMNNMTIIIIYLK